MQNPDDMDTKRRKFVYHFAYLNSTIRFPKPFAQFAGKPNAQHHHITFDELGFRNAEAVGPRTGADRIRVFVLGGSTIVEGDTEADTVPGRLETILGRNGFAHARVSNFGVVSSCFAQMSALLWSQLADFEPDLIVAVGGGTSVSNPWTFDPRPGYPYNAFVMEQLYDYLFDTSRTESLEIGLSYDDLTAILYVRLEQLRVECGWRTERWERAVIEHARVSMRRFSTLASALQTPVVCVLQPTIVRKNHRSESETSAGSAEYLSYLDRQYSRLEQACRDLGRSERKNALFNILDLSGAFADEDGQIFHDAAHYSSVGREIVAKSIAETILPILRRRHARPASPAFSMRRIKKFVPFA